MNLLLFGRTIIAVLIPHNWSTQRLVRIPLLFSKRIIGICSCRKSHGTQLFCSFLSVLSKCHLLPVVSFVFIAEKGLRYLGDNRSMCF